MSPILGYWNIRGLAQPIRLLHKYVGADFEERRYSFGDAPEFKAEDWFGEKYKLGLDMPNLPYYIDGDVKLTQSSAIMRYLGRRYDLNGITEEEKQRVDVVTAEATDYLMSLIFFIFGNETMDEGKKKHCEKFKRRCTDTEAYLGDRTWFAGDNITIADFIFYEFMDFNRLFFGKDVLNHVPKLKAFMERFEALPAIAAYHKSEECIHWPLIRATARWGGDPNSTP